MNNIDQKILEAAGYLKKQYPNGFNTRFAPSPTGYLHIGHIASMLIVEKLCELAGGRVILRIEDHDKTRSRPHYIKSIVEDLYNLGFKYDNVEVIDNEPILDRDYIQSSHLERYKNRLSELASKDIIYYCSCSRKDIKERTNELEKKELFYDGHCQHNKISSPETDTNSEQNAVRMVVEDISYQIGLHDPFIEATEQTPSDQCGDIVLRDKDQNYSYQFAVVCDDIAENIDVVIRGVDILNSTGRQIYLYDQLGARKRPTYLHHPILSDEKGKKLSKRFLSESVRELLENGMNPSEIRHKAWDMLRLV